jgi:hypothetical protein
MEQPSQVVACPEHAVYWPVLQPHPASEVDLLAHPLSLVKPWGPMGTKNQTGRLESALDHPGLLLVMTHPIHQAAGPFHQAWVVRSTHQGVTVNLLVPFALVRIARQHLTVHRVWPVSQACLQALLVMTPVQVAVHWEVAQLGSLQSYRLRLRDGQQA